MRVGGRRARDPAALRAAAGARGLGRGCRSPSLILLIGATGWFAHRASGARRGPPTPGGELRAAPPRRSGPAGGGLSFGTCCRTRSDRCWSQPRSGVGDVILLEAGLSFLGLGVQPPTPSWGGMILDAESRTWSPRPGPASFPDSPSSSPCCPPTCSATPCATPSIPEAHDPSARSGRTCGSRSPTGRASRFYPVDGVSFTLDRGRDARAGGRVGLRQEPHQPGAAPPGSAAGADRARQRRPARRHRRPRARGRGAAPDPGPSDRDDLPGPDDQPQPGVHRGRPDRRGHPGALQGLASRGAASARFSCSRRWASPTPRRGSTPTPTSSAAACASG